MNYDVEFKRATEATTLEVGDQLVSASGVEIAVLGIRLSGIHLGSVTILVKYEYNDNGRRGVEEVAFGNFRQNIWS